MPKFNDKIFMVTDQETAFRNAISKTFPDVVLLRCWNHLLKNIKYWVSRHNGKKLDEQFYLKEVRELFNCDSHKDYLNLLSQKQLKWDSSFKDYFNAHIDKDINATGKWTLEQLKVYNPYSGINTNVSEGSTISCI